jgi:hypothetical protein
LVADLVMSDCIGKSGIRDTKIRNLLWHYRQV